MRPVAPRLETAEEIMVAEEQTEYRTLPAALIARDGHRCHLTRWTFTPDERAAIGAGADLYISHLTGGGPLQPLAPQVGPEGL